MKSNTYSLLFWTVHIQMQWTIVTIAVAAYSYALSALLSTACLAHVMTSSRKRNNRRLPSVCLILMPFFLSTVSSYEIKPTVLLSKRTVAGLSAYLSCEIPRMPDRPALILWYKNQSKKPFYSFDFREMKSGLHKIHDSTDLGRRTNFSYETIPYPDKIILGHLEIKNVTWKDRGNYTCRVDFPRSQTMMSMLLLEVHEEVRSLSILDALGTEVDETAGPYKEGHRLYLVCKAFGGHPSPTVEWLQDGKVVSKGSHSDLSAKEPPGASWTSEEKEERSLSSNEVEAVFQIAALRREDQGENLTCRASNSGITKNKTKNVGLSVALRPLEVVIEGPMTPILAGRETELVCKSRGSKPPAKITWEPRHLMSNVQTQTSLDKNTTVSRVRFIPKSSDDGSVVRCKSTNEIVQEFHITADKTLEVTYAPEVEVQMASFLKPSDIKEGDDVYFECLFRANPKPKSIVWIHQGKRLAEDRAKGLIIHNRNLVLQNVRRSNRGSYQCEVTNFIGTATSGTVDLSVMFTPECKKPSNVTVSVSPEEEVKLNCEVNAFPDPESFHWKVNGTNGWERLPAEQVRQWGLRSTLVYRPNAHVLHQGHSFTSRGRGIEGQLETYGVVYCFAQNSVGLQKDPCIFNISPAGPPSELQSCLLVNQSATSLSVDCQPGLDGGLPATYNARVLDEGTGKLVANLSSDAPKFFIQDLAPGRDYLIVLTAFNEKGSSPSTTVEGFALKVAENKIHNSSPSEKSPILGLFVGVFCGFLLVVFVLALVTKARCRKRLLVHSDEVQGKQIKSPDEAPLSASSENSLEEEGEEQDNHNRRSRRTVVGLDLTTQTPDSPVIEDGSSPVDNDINLGRISCREGPTDQNPLGDSQSPPLLLGLSHSFVGGLPRGSSHHGMVSRESSGSSTPKDLLVGSRQSLHSVDLSHVTSNANKYYTLKISCTRPSTESFV